MYSNPQVSESTASITNFRDELTIFCSFRRQLSPKCQMLLFSATYDRQVMDFAQLIVKNPIIIKLKREQESLDNIKQYYVRCRNQDEKYQAIQNIYGVITIGQAIIFCHVSITSIRLCIGMIS